MDPRLEWIYKMILKYDYYVDNCKITNNIAYISLASKQIKIPTQHIMLEPRNK
jgi:hypothetical protein